MATVENRRFRLSILSEETIPKFSKFLLIKWGGECQAAATGQKWRDVVLGAFIVAGLKPARGAVVGGHPVRAGLKPAPTLPEIVRAFKTFSARRINESRATPGTMVWQRNYYEHVVRGENESNRIREYIANNPLQWEMDRENPLGMPDGVKRKAEAWEV